MLFHIYRNIYDICAFGVHFCHIYIKNRNSIKAGTFSFVFLLILVITTIEMSNVTACPSALLFLPGNSSTRYTSLVAFREKRNVGISFGIQKEKFQATMSTSSRLWEKLYDAEISLPLAGLLLVQSEPLEVTWISTNLSHLSFRTFTLFCLRADAFILSADLNSRKFNSKKNITIYCKGISLNIIK